MTSGSFPDDFSAADPFTSLPGSGGRGLPLPEALSAKDKKAKKSKAPRAPKAPKADKAPTKRVVSTNRTLALVAAAVAVVALLAFNTIKSSSQYVVVSKISLPALSPITSSELGTVAVSKDAVVSGAYVASSAADALAAAMKDISSKVTSVPLSANEQLSAAFFGQDQALAADLSASERLVSINQPVSNAVAGSLNVGDHVEVIASESSGPVVLAPDAMIVSIRASQSQYDNAASSQSGSTSANQVLPQNPVPGMYILRTDQAHSELIGAAQAGNTPISLLYQAQ